MKYFGTDGIRGIAYKELNSELAFKLGQAIKEVYEPVIVIIGMDTRASSPMLAYSIANGLLTLGVNIDFAGVVSTPMIAHYSKLKNIIGIMITASHNPYQDNGIKVFKYGYKTTKEDELKLEAHIKQENLTFTSFGTFNLSNEIHNEYLKLYKQLNLGQSDLKIAYDSANGANYLIAKTIFNKYAPNSIQINNKPNGVNINLNCGSTHLKSIVDQSKLHKLDIAFSFDGDGDRIMVIDDNQKIYDGDLVIYIIASYLKQKGLLNKNTVVLTKMSNPGILKALSDQGIDYILTDVGDKHVFQELKNNNYSIGGEASGHIILNDIFHSGDALLVALYLLKILDELEKPLAKLIANVKLYPFKLTNIKNIDKSILKRDTIIKKINEVKAKLGKHSLLLVRPSGTENLIRVTISHQEQSVVNDLTKELVKSIEKEGEKIWKNML